MIGPICTIVARVHNYILYPKVRFTLTLKCQSRDNGGEDGALARSVFEVTLAPSHNCQHRHNHDGGNIMAMKPHPVTGLPINTVVQRFGPLDEKETWTAQVLLDEGHPRWMVAGMIGRHPLSFRSLRPSPQGRRVRMGSRLSTKAARDDTRQCDMFQAQGMQED